MKSSEGAVPRRAETTSLEPQIPEQTLRRIPLYHQILAEMQSRGESNVSSKHLAQFFRIDDTQVRKDVSLIGYKGKPKSGYSITGLKIAIEEFLGINYENTAILIGVGHLGSALSQYPGLSQYGLRLVAVFDNNPSKIGSVLGAFTILSMESLTRVVRSFDVGIAIICVPKEAAQLVVNRVVSLGIKAIWNFSPTQLAVPSDVVVRNENIALGLAILSHYVKNQKKDSRGASDAAVKNPPQKLIEIFSRFPPKREHLVAILEQTQKTYGYVPGEAIDHISTFLGVPRDHVADAVAFYPVFRLSPPARFDVKICSGENCSRKGSSALRVAAEAALRISVGETTTDGLFALELVPCSGLCSQAPNVFINDKQVPATPDGLVERLEKLRRENTANS